MAIKVLNSCSLHNTSLHFDQAFYFLSRLKEYKLYNIFSVVRKIQISLNYIIMFIKVLYML